MTDIKRVIAYSTINSLGLMMVALGSGSLTAAIFYLFAHAFFKALLFLAAGSVIHATEQQDVSQLGGPYRRMPLTATVFGLGALLAVILTGQPPYAGETAEAVRVQAVRGKLEDCFVRLDTSGAEPELLALCKRCLAFEPAERPADAGAVAQAVAGLRAAADADELLLVLADVLPPYFAGSGERPKPLSGARRLVLRALRVRAMRRPSE